MPIINKSKGKRQKVRVKGQKFGYTLIEFLVVIGILALSVGSILLFLTTTIKGSNQATISAEVKQNGQNVLDLLQEQIRNGIDVKALAGGELLGGQSGIFLTLSSGEKLTIICFNSDATHNGYMGGVKDPASTIVPHSTLSDFTNNPLTNTDTKSGIDVICTSNSFQVPTSSQIKTVAINFSAQQGILAPSRVDFKANASFQTTVVLRQYR